MMHENISLASLPVKDGKKEPPLIIANDKKQGLLLIIVDNGIIIGLLNLIGEK